MPQAAEPGIRPFEADYRVYAYAAYLGEGRIALRIDGERYRMSLDAEARGLAKLLVRDGLHESASGLLTDDGPRPAVYRSQRLRRISELRFDWQAGKASARRGDRQADLALQPRTVDPLSLYLLAMWDLQRGHTAASYRLIDGIELKTYRIRHHARESLDTPLGRLSAVRISRSRPGKNRVTSLWFAPALAYLPVRVVQTEAGEQRLRLEIQAIKWPRPIAARAVPESASAAARP